jgi:hypothetical protein
MAGWLASVSVQLYTPFLRVLLTGHRTAVNNLIWIFTICFYCEKGQGKSKKKITRRRPVEVICSSQSASLYPVQ